MNTEKQELIDLALAKLTEEEKEVLSLIKKPKKIKVKKSYNFKVFYMIGDANGHTDEQATISVNNPFLPIITGALDKLKVCKGSWGIQLKPSDYHGNYKSKNINKLEYDLLCLVSGYSSDEEDIESFLKENNFEVTEANLEFLGQFEGLFIGETEYSFLVYQGYKLK